MLPEPAPEPLRPFPEMGIWNPRADRDWDDAPDTDRDPGPASDDHGVCVIDIIEQPAGGA